MAGAGTVWRAERCWRLLTTALLYAVFGMGSVVVAVFVVLPLWIGVHPRERRARLWRGVVQRLFAGFVRLAGMLGVFHVRVHDAEALREPGQLIIANHPSLLDVVILISLAGDVDCVIKGQLSRNPFVAMQVALADYIRNDSPSALVDECARRLDAGRSLIIFPEGTRTRRGQPLRFRRGTARTVLASQAPLRPVLIHCVPHALAKGDAWFRIPEHAIRYTFRVCPCLDVQGFRDDPAAESLRARRLTRYLEDWFTRRLDVADGDGARSKGFHARTGHETGGETR